jgi:DNA-binding CsgD family transcriptional regulator
MTETRNTITMARSGTTLALSGLLVVQAVCAGFFTLDVIADITGWQRFEDGAVHYVLEMAAVIALTVGVGLTAVQIRRIRSRQARMEAQLRIASGAFMELLEERFDAWALTPSERDVALLAIKGLSIAEIAEVRHTKDGTVKAQCNAIYSKAGVTGRQQLLSLFIEELMADGVMPETVAAA